MVKESTRLARQAYSSLEDVFEHCFLVYIDIIFTIKMPLFATVMNSQGLRYPGNNAPATPDEHQIAEVPPRLQQPARKTKIGLFDFPREIRDKIYF